KILAVWSDLEKLVQSGKVVSIGVSDFILKALQMLVDAAETKPCVNHYNIDGCCVVSLPYKINFNTIIIHSYNEFFTGSSRSPEICSRKRHSAIDSQRSSSFPPPRSLPDHLYLEQNFPCLSRTLHSYLGC